MKNANAIAAAVLLAALTTPLAGCDIGAAQNASLAAADASLLPKARHRLDTTRNRIWLLDRDGAALIDLARPARETLALADWLRVSEEHGCLPDLALGPRGEAVITSNVVPALWRVDGDSRAVSVHRPVLEADADRDIGFSGLVYSPQHGAYFAISYQHGSLWRIDAGLQRAQKVRLSASVPQACGLAMLPGRVGRLPGLCVRTARDTWRVEFAPDGRSAYVGMDAVSCNDANP